MKQMYYYLFYKFYKLAEAAPSRWLSDWKAGIIIITLEVWSLFSLINYYNVWVDRYMTLKKAYIIPIIMLICFINYMAFIHSDRWKDYVKDFDKLPKNKNKIGSWIVFSITIFIIANLIFSYYLISEVDWSRYAQ